jgi:methylene-tetrahydromethanopterin dehydrogenase
MFFPGEQASPFDVNMAADAGFEIIVPYTGVGADEVTDLVQDAIFSRPPKMFSYTGAFIGGWDVNLAATMVEKAKQAMVPPFEISLFADPNGAYTTSAALVALIGKHLKGRGIEGFKSLKTMIFGGGPVGVCAAVLIAGQGGQPKLVRLTQPDAAKQAAVVRFGQRYGIELDNLDGHTDEAKRAVLQSAQVVIAAAKEGVQVLSKDLLQHAGDLLVAADVNAVPPAGIEGLKSSANGVELGAGQNAVGIGALAIGGVKYKVQQGLFKQMLETDKALALDLPDAYRLATQLV